jgi:hypothetical protein|tara:strand:+ start:219 stop:509 length:291 start_codon:yes stop_codon:yes gene_type:complete
MAGGTFTSDQQAAHATSDGQLVPATQRARVTYIQAAGVANGNIKLYNGTTTSDPLVAEFEFDVDGLSVYVPGSGILFDSGVYLDLSNTPGVTILYT